MVINGLTVPDPVLGDGQKAGCVTYTSTSVNNIVRTYVRTFRDTYTLTFDKLATEEYEILIDHLKQPVTISGLLNGTFLCLNNPIEAKQGRHFWSLTITLREL